MSSNLKMLTSISIPNRALKYIFKQDNWRRELASSCGSEDVKHEAKSYGTRYEDLQEQFIATRRWCIQESGLYVLAPSYCNFAGKLIPEDALIDAGDAYEGFRQGVIGQNAPGLFGLVVSDSSRPLVL